MDSEGCKLTSELLRALVMSLQCIPKANALAQLLWSPSFWFSSTSQVMWQAAAAKSLQSCPTLCDPIDSSPPGSAVLGILQARTLEWVAISFSIAWKWKVKVKSLSRDWLVATPWTVAHQAHPSMGFSKQEYWSGTEFLSSINLAVSLQAKN